MISLHETCEQYVARRLSEGWGIVWQSGVHLILSSLDGNILRPVDLRNDIETLRPSAGGDETALTIDGESPAATNWESVDEVSADECTTYVSTTVTASYVRDLYNLPASSGAGIINFIKVYFRCASHSVGVIYGKPSLKSNSTVTDGTEVFFAGNIFLTDSEQWNTNPADGEAWEWSDIDALQIGVSLKGSFANKAQCTQVYVEVDYTPEVGLENKSANMAAKMVAAGLI